MSPDAGKQHGTGSANAKNFIALFNRLSVANNLTRC
jgi:hypothetical protein